MRLPILLLFSLLVQLAGAQGLLKGTVVDAASGRPVAGASVFLSNTSIGTTAASDGHFSLNIPAGRHDLVVSSIGYETNGQTINSASLPEALTVRLKEKAKELDNVVIRRPEKNGWDTYGSFFLANFIGTSPQGKRCTLKNQKALRFYHDKKTNTLEVSATEPLLIENKALGYRIRYQLESFVYDYQSRFLQYTGYPLFEDLDGGNGKQRRWADARRTVFYGSQLHFMRALYRNKLIEEGFTVYRQRKIPNAKRIRSTFNIPGGRIIELDNGARFRCDAPPDTINAYQSYVGREPLLNLVEGFALPGDSIAYAVDAQTAGVEFHDYLSILYAKGQTPEEYQRTVLNGNYRMQSEITLITGKPIEVQANGYYYDPLNLLSNGWWAWSEKIGTMLPYDYDPAK